jgi:hypothetical protein
MQTAVRLCFVSSLAAARACRHPVTMTCGRASATSPTCQWPPAPSAPCTSASQVAPPPTYVCGHMQSGTQRHDTHPTGLVHFTNAHESTALRAAEATSPNEGGPCNQRCACHGPCDRQRCLCAVAAAHDVKHATLPDPERCDGMLALLTLVRRAQPIRACVTKLRVAQDRDAPALGPAPAAELFVCSMANVNGYHPAAGNLLNLPSLNDAVVCTLQQLYQAISGGGSWKLELEKHPMVAARYAIHRLVVG